MLSLIDQLIGRACVLFCVSVCFGTTYIWLVLFCQAARTHGDPYDPRAPNGTGPSGEYVILTNHSLIFTPLMFIICGIMLFWEFNLNDWVAEPLAENPSYGPSVETLIEAGAKRTDLIVDDGDWWRLISRETASQSP